MSWQAIGAVQEASRFVGHREFVGYRVLLAIAWYADENGVAGRAGQRTACPSHKAIAGRARVHVNTVRNWLPRLEAAGELALERHGAGRGSHMVYRILLPMAQPGAGGRVLCSEEHNPAPAGDQNAGELEERLERLEKKVRELERDLEGGALEGRGAETPQERSHDGTETPQGNAKTPQETPHDGIGTPHGSPQENTERPHENIETPHEKATKATRVQREHVVDPLDPFFDPDIDPEGDPGGVIVVQEYKAGKGHTAPPCPAPSGTGQKKKAFQERVQALAEVCGLDLRLTTHRRQCEQAARQLAPYDAALILQRFAPLSGDQRPSAWHWYVDDWRGARKREQPRPRDVVANISRERVQVAPAAAQRANCSPAAEENLGPAQIAFREYMREEEARKAKRKAAQKDWMVG